MTTLPAPGDTVRLVNVGHMVGTQYEGALCTVVRAINYAGIYYGDRLIENPHCLVTLVDNPDRSFYVEAQHLRAAGQFPVNSRSTSPDKDSPPAQHQCGLEAETNCGQDQPR